jgi:hypothetical protein
MSEHFVDLQETCSDHVAATHDKINSAAPVMRVESTLQASDVASDPNCPDAREARACTSVEHDTQQCAMPTIDANALLDTGGSCAPVGGRGHVKSSADGALLMPSAMDVEHDKRLQAGSVSMPDQQLACTV